MPRKKKSESGTQSEHSDSNDSNNEEQLNNAVGEEIEEAELEETQLEEDNEELENGGSESEGQGLSLNILIHVRTLLETAIKRGAYKPNELSTVGKIYDIFNSSLNYIESQDNDNNSS